MIEVIIHGLVSGLIWSAILGACLIAIAAVITATAPVSGRAPDTATGTTRVRVKSPSQHRARRAPIAIPCPIRPFRSKTDKEEYRDRVLTMCSDGRISAPHRD